MNEIDFIRRLVTTEVIQTGRQWRRTVDLALVAHDISEACAAPLLWIGRLGGGVRQVTLAAHVGIEGPSLVRLLDQLVLSGHVIRKDDPTDRRAKTVWLTKKGEALTAKIESLLVALRAEILANISREDLDATLRVLRALDNSGAHNEPSREANSGAPSVDCRRSKATDR